MCKKYTTLLHTLMGKLIRLLDKMSLLLVLVTSNKLKTCNYHFFGEFLQAKKQAIEELKSLREV